ncbi:MAG: outer membrane lipoprotein carrier protein LolA [Bacilli bacterium]|nr:outer membrane lipoprotein carrier protein LolA [Bacilli bacterium]
MKKIFILLFILVTVFLTGCTKENSDNIFKNLTDKINNLESYKLDGNLEVKNDNNSYSYNVEVSFMEKDKFRVSLVNTSNNHEQVILRNDDGVFVLTPSLNKSFKFQSDWPYNNSQIYLLGSIIDDLNNDANLTKEEKDGKYIFTSKVNYPNNPDLVKQNVIVTKDLMIEKVEILNTNDEVEMSFKVNNTDYSPTFDESYFEVNSIINTTNQNNNNSNNDNNNNNSSTNQDTTDGKTTNGNNQTDTNKNNSTDTNSNTDKNNNPSANNTQTNRTEPTATLEDIIYPLYLPSGTVLEEQEKVSKTDGERVILTFGGEKGFTLVEETVSKEEEFTVIPTYGEPGFVNDTIGAVTDNSLNWISGNIEYYLVSDVMNSEELLNIANSIDVSAVASLK